MKHIVICIQLLIGHYYIIIDRDHIISYYIYKGEHAKEDIRIFNVTTGVLTQFDAEGQVQYSGEKQFPQNQDLKIVNSELVQENYEYLDFRCEKYRITHTFLESSNQVIAEEAYCDLPLVNQYLGTWKDSISLSYIKPRFDRSSLYSVEVYETTHCGHPEDKQNRVLISKLEYIIEKDSLDSEIQLLLEKL